MIARLARMLPVLSVPVLLVPAVLAGIVGSTPAQAADPRCSAPDGTAGTVAPLSHVAAVLRPGGTLNVLVIGSATVFGPEAALAAGAAAREAVRNGALPGSQPPGPNTAPSSAATRPAATTPGAPSPAAFPMVMGRALEAATPGLTVHVTVRGARSLGATEMVEMMQAALKEQPFQLVIWQTGTLEAVRNVQPGDFAQTLADGQQAARDVGADLVLVDPQYSRFLQTNANLDPYLQAFGQAAAVPDVVWFHRWELMHEWVGNGQIDLEHTARADRKAAVELLHVCLGGQLAQLVEQSARS